MLYYVKPTGDTNMETIYTDCSECEEPLEIEVSEDYGQLTLEFDECPKCGAFFGRFMKERIERAYTDEATFSSVVGR
jgi:hypothetical protein